MSNRVIVGVKSESASLSMRRRAVEVEDMVNVWVDWLISEKLRRRNAKL